MDAIRIAVAVCLVLAPAPAELQVYRWTGPGGEIFYGDFPPAEGQAVQRVEVPAAPAVTPGRTTSSRERRRSPDLSRMQVLANDGRIAVGMPARMVAQAWGDPETVGERASRTGRTVVWSYTRHGRKVKISLGDDGVVKSIAW